MTSFFAMLFAWLTAWTPGPCGSDGQGAHSSPACESAPPPAMAPDSDSTQGGGPKGTGKVAPRGGDPIYNGI